MKTFRFALALAVLFGMTGVANAYRINVLDPITTYQIMTPNFTVVFSACETGQLPHGATPDPGSLCFSGLNETGATITTIQFSIPTSGPLAHGNPACDAVSGQSIYANATCSRYSDGNTVFFFSGLNILTDTDPNANAANDSFLIYLSGVPQSTVPSDIQPAQVTQPPTLTLPQGVTPLPPLSSTPEPGSFALLSTGLASLGATAWRKRRVLAGRNS